MSASNRIYTLPLHLANQIAAGEVIERPASVVKELIENSIDAGASQITIDIEGAGNQLIRVRDNGFGIHPEDLALALSRHATSKLHSSEQLSHIDSLGFRGEALPSIASVSELSLRSRQQDSDCGWQISGDNDIPNPVAHPIGTTVEVRELFFNVPARRHFLRGNKTEQHHITTTLYRLALCQFEIGFQCQLSASTTLKLPAAVTPEQQQQRVAKICGKAFINNSLYIQQQYDDIELSGWLGKAEAHRPQTDVHYFFINGRVIRDRVINHAIRQAYADMIPSGRYPAFVLYLTMPLDRVDINVHPTKHEVRFRDARLVHGLITRALQDALASSAPSQTFSSSEPQSNKPTPNVVADNSTPYQTRSDFPSQDSALKDFGTISILIHQRYAITQSSQGCLLLDLQKAQRLLRQQQLHHAIESDSLSSRPILVPIKVELTPEALQSIIQHQQLLATLGFSFQFNKSDLIIKSIPSLLVQVDVNELICALATTLLDQNITINRLTLFLEQRLPLTPVHNVQQAEMIVNQLSTMVKTEEWCRILDQKTLSSLF
ncbi:MAG: DNA mismatch repair endonuclease MutL [Gammaproteobacteria bacterium]|nr:DNA mismatch repair endonuclease MutL [Gammaproteobacteria bacterium]MDH5591526.1 DNA mismatch repair endonuclease MutL [Gammaproteobacteria bacterium]